MPLLVGMGSSAGIAFLTFFLVKLIEARNTVLVQRPLPAMDVLDTAGIKVSSVLPGGFTILFTLNKFQAGTRTVTMCHLSPLSTCTVSSALVILPFRIQEILVSSSESK